MPTRSTSAHGPIGQPAPFRIPVSRSSGVTVGIIGLTTSEALTATIPANVRGLAVSPLVETIRTHATALRSQAEIPFSGDADLRQVAVEGDRLVFAWVNPADNRTGEMLAVPRALHDEVLADEDGDWFAFKSDFDGALYVDLNRMLVEQPA